MLLLTVRLFNTLTPVILAGICNMVWVKFGPDALRIPLDHRKVLPDGKRLFGANKTYLGLIGYVVLHMVFTVLWGALAQAIPTLANNNYFYLLRENHLIYNLFVGFLLGMAYAVFELPNSFLKRRAEIAPGTGRQGPKGYFFTILDQIDSIAGVGLVVWFFYPLGIGRYIFLLFIGFFVHALINFLLYVLGLRKHPL